MPVTATTRLQFFWRDSTVPRGMRSGVSLHSHTMYSQEGFEVIPDWIIRMGKLKLFGEPVQHKFEFRRGFWTPPLAPRQAYRLEEKQIEREFDLPALVSLTDHDDIRAGFTLRILPRFSHIPVSTEWTIPYGPTFFHLGVHNLRPESAGTIMRDLASYTSSPAPRRVRELLASLVADPEILIVLNHPLWDEKHIGQAEHETVLTRFLEEHGRSLHALELNGLRSAEENQRVTELAAAWNLVAVAGGDRHGLEPNALVNLSRAATFAEFVDEIRCRRFSHVVYMPQYQLPLPLRVLHTVIDVLRDYPENFEGRRTWGDRVFYRDAETADPVPFASVWAPGTVGFVRRLLLATRLVDRRRPSVILTGA